MSLILKNSRYAIMDTHHGKMCVFHPDYYVGRSLMETGEYGYHECKLLNEIQAIIESSKKGPYLAIDAGANMGCLSLSMAQRPGWTVVAVECQPTIYQALCSTVTLNPHLDVRPLQAVTGFRFRTKRETLNPAAAKIPVIRKDAVFNHAGFSVNNPVTRRLAIGNRSEHDPEFYEVRNLSLREICEATSVRHWPDIIKLDIEGCEQNALEESKAFLQMTRPVLYVENNQRGMQGDLIRALENLGYESFWHMPPLFRPDNFLGNPSCPWEGDPVAQNMLCIHEDRSGLFTTQVLENLLGDVMIADADPAPSEIAYSIESSGTRRVMPATADNPAEGFSFHTI